MTDERIKEFVELCKHEAIAGKRGPWLQSGDKYAFSHDLILTYDAGYDNSGSETATWLPSVFDYQRPERGLWGMVDWSKWELETCYGEQVIMDTKQVKEIVLTGKYPLPIALAKAIIWQHERKEP